MASLTIVRLNKGDCSSWGFRLQGGKDFGTPLVIQKVIVGTPAERAGLVAGDSVIKVNNTDVFNLRHKDAQDVILRAGHSFELTIQRGGSTWKPAVITTGSYSTPTSNINNVSPVTKTSLAAQKTENIGAIGTGHNLSAKPFNQINGTVNGGPKLVNQQYNSPLKLYSEESIAETLSAQTEVLSTGALGVNFKKNEKNYDATNSAVFRMLQESENEPRSPEPSDYAPGIDTSPIGIAGLRHVTAPETKPSPPSPHLPPGQNICADCERLIVGVFVRIKDKNLHVECFKCSTCGTSLKNVGYYNINNKLYCDVHAKLAARNNPPAPNLVPVTVSPGGKVPSNAISTALASHSYPTSAPLSPKINSYQTPSFSSGPKTFGSINSPNYITPHNAAPLSPVAPISAPSFSPVSSTGRFPSSKTVRPAGRSVQNIVWPPSQEEPEPPTACPIYFPPPSQIHIPLKPKIRNENLSESTEYSDIEELNIMKHIQNTKMSICSEEVGSYTGRRSIGESAGTIAETVERQRLVETIVRSRPQSPPPMESSVHDATDSVNSNITEHINGSNEFRKKSCELKRPIQFATTTLDDIQKAQLKSVENSVPQKWESPLLQALTTVSNDVFSQIPSKKSATPLASALAIAPSEPFNPVSATTLELIPLPAETIPYLPPEHPVFDKSNNEMKNQHSKDDTTGKEQIRSKKKKDMKDKYLEDLPKPQEKLSMLEALTTASERSYSPLIINTITMDESEEEFVVQNRKMGTADGKQMKNEEILEKEHLRKIETSEKKQVQKSSKSATESQTIQTSSVDEHKSGAQMLPIFQGFSCSFHNKTDHSEFQVQISTTPPVPHVVVESQDRAIFEERSVTKTITEESDTQEQSSTIEKQSEEIILKRPLPMTALHKPQGLPQYQVNLSDSIEADLKLAEKIETAQSRHDEKKHKIERENNVQNVKCVQQPIITIEPGDSTLTQSQNSFKPIIDNRPPSTTSSTRPRTLTPSMINKPSSILPYYQANLVAQKYSAPMVNLLDPKSPNISRSPSPCPENMSCTLAPENMSSIRPKSPAEGPPPNPLESSKSILSREGFQVDRAKKNLTEFIPQYKNKRDLIEDIYGKHTTRDDYQGSDSQAYSSIEQGVIYTSEAHVQNIPAAIEVAVNEAVGLENISRQNITEQSQQCKLIKGQQSHVQTSECSEDIQSTVSISQKCQSQDLEEFRKSQTESIQQSNDGLKQIHRKKLVTEEFEHTQRSGEMTIEKNVTTTKKYPFNDTNNPIIESQGIIGLHVTAPHPISSPFLKSKSSVTDIQKSSSCQSSQKSSSVCNSTNFEKQIALSQEASTKQIQPQTLNPKMPTPKFDATQLPIHKVVPSEQPIEQRTIVPSKPIKHVSAPGSSQSNQDVKKSNIPLPNTGTSGGRQTGAIGISPKRGRGVLNAAALGGNRVPLCGQCHNHIRGPFITALGKIWCPDHFICATPSCRRPLHDLGFVEEHGKLFCEFCFEQYLAPPCSKCNSKIKGDCLKAIGKVFHPECFNCVHCGKLFGNSPFFIENGSPYCDVDWNELFTTKCFACGFPVEAGDRWVEALNNNYHSQCFNCTMCKKNLEGQSFFAKGGRPFCKNHAR